MTHFTDIELHRWRDSGPGSDRERVIAHLAECAQCAARYAAAIRNRSLRAEPAADAAAFAAAGRRVPNRRRWIAPAAAAAAALMIVIAVPLMIHRDRTPDLHLRGASIETFRTNRELVWASGIAAAKYHVEIGDATGVIHVVDTPRTRIPMPAHLKPGVEYWWTVTARDAQGRSVAVSPRRTFTIAR
jgi:anti-sigma factor RsiW